MTHTDENQESDTLTEILKILKEINKKLDDSPSSRTVVINNADHSQQHP